VEREKSFASSMEDGVGQRFVDPCSMMPLILICLNV